jgi:hypothetical protein
VLKSLDRSGERISFKVISNDYLLKRSGGWNRQKLFYPERTLLYFFAKVKK